jgi:outer membrane receptor protein involved in Fe transport
MRSRLARLDLMAGAAAVAVLSVVAGAPAAFAQQVATAEEPATLDAVVVTGSRIKRPNLVSASPMTVVGGDDIKYQGATSVESVLNRLPQFTADSNENGSNGSDGTARVNLRNMGSSRVLVLVDGQRMLPAETADVNFIPSALVDRIDVVTGGASAVYGSDAVSGVVNFILKKDLNGVRLDGQYSIAQHTNDASYPRSLITQAGYKLPDKHVTDGAKIDVNLAFGMNAPDDRGNVTFYVGYRELKPVTQDSRDYSACGLNLAGERNNALVCGGSSNNEYGLFSLISGPNAGLTLNNTKDGNKTWVPYDSSFLYNYAPTNYIQRSDSRYTAGAFAHYEISKAAEVYGSFMFMDDHTFSQAAPSALFQGTTFKINCNNPLMSASQAATLCGSAAGTDVNQDTFIGYRLTGPGSSPRRDDLRHTAYRINFGSRGEIAPGWTYDAGFLYSQVVFDESYKNNVDNAKAAKALQVVSVNGTPTCKSVIDGTDPACVPIDVFKYQGLSSAAYKYLYAPTYTHGVQREKVLNVTVNGDLGQYGIKSPWADDGMALALGVEHRREELKFEADALAQAAGTKENAGAFSVTEAYGEADLPLIQDAPFIKALSVNAGYRTSKYDYLDKRVSTYKVELQYAPTSDIRFRASYNRAVRAANISELFAPQSLGNVSAKDPCAMSTLEASAAACALTGVTAAQYGKILPCPAETCVTQGGGNPDLKPEVADTRTAGVVLTPRFLPGFSMSLDYFDIYVDKYIGSVDASTVIKQCTETGNPYFCSLFHRDPTSGVLFGDRGYIVATNLNTGFLQTSGLDVTGNYRLDLSSLTKGGDWGSLDFSFVGTYLNSRKIEQLPGLGAYNCKGLFGPTCGQPNPAWRHQMRTTWSLPWVPATVSVNWRYFGGTDLSSNDSNPSLHSPDYVEINRKIKAYSYFDLAADWKVREQLSLRAGMNNAFDKDPPVIAAGLLSAFGNGNTYPGVYDPMGRTLFVGLTMDF